MDRDWLRSFEPASRAFGGDRGRPIDRHYIETFVRAHAADVRGRVLEFGDPAYTRRFGGARVTRSDVVFPRPGHPHATLVADLADPASFPVRAYDCIVCTQVLMYVYEVRTAIATLHRALDAGGVVLATFPGISQLSRVDVERFGEYWRFTSQSAKRLFGEAFGADRVDVHAYGNVLAAAGFLYGLAAEELAPHELDHVDPDYEVTIAVRAAR